MIVIIQKDGELVQGTVTGQKEDKFQPGKFFYNITLDSGEEIVYYGEFDEILGSGSSE